MPYLCLIRTDIDDGILQVLDLQPNESQRSLIYEPPGQTKYVNRAQNNTVATSTAVGVITTNTAYSGLAAYLLENVDDDDNAGIALTAAFSNTIALAIIAAMDGGTATTLAAINALIQATTGGVSSSLTGNNSTGTLADVLRILAGGEYTVPVSTTVQAGGAFSADPQGAFTTGQFRHTYDSGALNISIGEGHLSEFIAATYSYGGTAGAALIVYDDDGTVLT